MCTSVSSLQGKHGLGARSAPAGAERGIGAPASDGVGGSGGAEPPGSERCCVFSPRVNRTAELRRRQTGYGRGRRMVIESDRADALSGIRHGESTGAPIALLIPNKDWENWQRTMYVEPEMPADTSGSDRPPVTRPRPGHADLAGFVKYGHGDMRNVLERASARETAARVAAGAIARQLLATLGADIVSHVITIGAASIADPLAFSYEAVKAIPADTPLHCADPGIERQM